MPLSSTLNSFASTGAGVFTFSGAFTGTQPLTYNANIGATGGIVLSAGGTGLNYTGTFTNSGTAPFVFPTSQITAPPAGSTYINTGVANTVATILQNGTSDLVLNATGAAYNNGIDVRNGTLIYSGLANSLGAATNVVTLGDASSIAGNVILDLAGKVNNSTANGLTFSNPVNVSSSVATVYITASDFNPQFNGLITLGIGASTLHIVPHNSGGSTIIINGGVTGAGNIKVSDVGNKNTNLAQFTGTAAVNNTGTITFDNTTQLTVATGSSNTGVNLISAPLGAAVTGVIQNSATDPLLLSNANPSYSGTTTVTQGVLQFGNVSTLGSGSLVINGGSIDNQIGAGSTLTTTNATTFGGSFTFVGTNSLALEPNAVTIPNATTPTITVTANTLTIPNFASSTGNLVKAGAGTLALTGINRFSGSTRQCRRSLARVERDACYVGGQSPERRHAPDTGHQYAVHERHPRQHRRGRREQRHTFPNRWNGQYADSPPAHHHGNYPEFPEPRNLARIHWRQDRRLHQHQHQFWRRRDQHLVFTGRCLRWIVRHSPNLRSQRFAGRLYAGRQQCRRLHTDAEPDLGRRLRFGNPQCPDGGELILEGRCQRGLEWRKRFVRH